MNRLHALTILALTAGIFSLSSGNVSDGVSNKQYKAQQVSTLYDEALKLSKTTASFRDEQVTEEKSSFFKRDRFQSDTWIKKTKESEPGTELVIHDRIKQLEDLHQQHILEMLNDAYEYSRDHEFTSYHLTAADMEVADNIINFTLSHWSDWNDEVTDDEFQMFVRNVMDAFGVSDVAVNYNYDSSSSYDSLYNIGTNEITINTRMSEDCSLKFGTILFNEMRNAIHEVRHAYQWHSVFEEFFNNNFSDQAILEFEDNFNNYYNYNGFTNNDYNRYVTQPTESDARLFSYFVVDKIHEAISAYLIR